MSEVAKLAKPYPHYCYTESPTFKAWSFFRGVDIANLRYGGRCEGRFEGNVIFFYKNLPIRWVRMVGIIVALDDYQGRRVLTVDDSSGVTIECNIEAKKPDEVTKEAPAERRWDRPPPPPPEYGDFDVGHVVDVRGSLGTFRDFNKITVTRMRHVRSTADEIDLWEKRSDFREKVLDVPWVLPEGVIDRCKNEFERARGSELAIIQGKQKLKKADYDSDNDPYSLRKRKPRSEAQARRPNQTKDAAKTTDADAAFDDDPYALRRGGKTIWSRPESGKPDFARSRSPTKPEPSNRSGYFSDEDPYRLKKRVRGPPPTTRPVPKTVDNAASHVVVATQNHAKRQRHQLNSKPPPQHAAVRETSDDDDPYRIRKKRGKVVKPTVSDAGNTASGSHTRLMGQNVSSSETRMPWEDDPFRLRKGGPRTRPAIVISSQTSTADNHQTHGHQTRPDGSTRHGHPISGGPRSVANQLDPAMDPYSLKKRARR